MKYSKQKPIGHLSGWEKDHVEFCCSTLVNFHSSFRHGVQRADYILDYSIHPECEC
jgi:hypothetical protein